MTSVSTFFKHKAYIFLHCNRALQVLDVNQYTKDVTLSDSISIIGHSLVDFFHKSDQQEVRSLLTANTCNPEQHFTHRWRLKNGRYMWCKWHADFSEDSESIYIVGEDISEQKRIRSAMTVLEKVTNTGYWEIDLDTGYLYWSRKVHEIHETDWNTFHPKLEDGLRFYPPQSVEKLKQALDKLEKNGEPYELDLDFVSDKDSHLIVKANGFSETRHGSVVRNFGTFEDLTQKKIDEEALAQLEQRIMLALHAAKIGVWEYDIAEDRLNWDDRLFEIYGQDRHDFSFKLEGWRQCVHPDDIEDAESKFAEAVNQQSFFQHTFRVLTKTNEIRYLLGMASTVVDRDGRVNKVTGVNIDLTESELLKKDLEAAMQEAKQNAEKANEMAKRAQSADLQKTIFLANMSHEIRTPISGVIGLLDMLSNENENSVDVSSRDKSTQYINLAKNAANHLLKIIGNILDFSKIEAGKITVVDAPFNLHQLLREMSESFTIQCEEKGLKVHLNTEHIDGQPVLGDEVRIKQVIYNLMSNALKFTERGSITIDAKLLPMTSGKCNLSCSVTDTGCGVPQSKIDSLFLPFEQVDGSSTRTSHGTGLGLAISQKLCQKMNGNISVESEVDKGSRFTFNIELSRITQDDETKIDSFASVSIADSKTSLLSGLRVLVVEDNEINQMIVCDMLKNMGVGFVVANDGEEAIQILERSPKLDVILMDCLMPRMDGYKATEVIRSDHSIAQYQNIPIIALTANAVVGDREKCLSHGMTDYMKKPVEKALLTSMLLKYSNNNGAV